MQVFAQTEKFFQRLLNQFSCVKLDFPFSADAERSAINNTTVPQEWVSH